MINDSDRKFNQKLTNYPPPLLNCVKQLGGNLFSKFATHFTNHLTNHNLHL